VSSERIILGIDPGTTIMGYGIIKVQHKKLSLERMGVLHLSKLPSHPAKLRRIFERTLELIDSYNPDELAIEAPFFGKNVQSMLKLGRAQGVAIAAAVYRDIPMTEYSPRKIKQSVTGAGTASKEQVASMLQSMFKITDMPKHNDATDGLAVAVCHYLQGELPVKPSSNKSGTPKTSKGGWAAFAKKNPGRIK